MQLLDVASMFGRHEFLIRRLHSLLGLAPIGGYLVFHLATNGAILDGLDAYQYRADQIHKLGATTILVLEWSLIFLPILFHALVGMVIVTRGKRNVTDYPYEGNIRYTLQRFTGVAAFLFIFWHVFQMHGWFRWEWWVQYVARPLGGAAFDPGRAYSAAEVLQSFWLFPVLYAAGTLACVYHLANGIWTMGITWGVWTSPRAQQWAKGPCAAFGLALAVVGMGALWGMMRAEAPRPERTPGKVVEKSRLEIEDWRLEIENCRFKTASGAAQSSISNLQSPIFNLQSPIFNFQSPFGNPPAAPPRLGNSIHSTGLS